MEALQFGRWLSERRRARGWQSQRALAEATEADAHLGACGISEAFLARLEAGLLAYPFRGAVRRRVLALGWLLCTTSREVEAYLRAAGLSELCHEERDEVAALRRYFDARRKPSPVLLPARPARLPGREGVVRNLVEALRAGRPGLYAITGVPGVGKSAVAYEALHRIAADERERLRLFPDGIVTFACTGRMGTCGLAALLHEIAASFEAERAPLGRGRRGAASRGEVAPGAPGGAEERAGVADVALAINRARVALAGKRALLLLDNVEVGFPIRRVLDAVLVASYDDAARQRDGAPGRAEQVVMATCHVAPTSAMPVFHCQVRPLGAGAAVALLAGLLGHQLEGEERRAAERICAAVGYLPLAIELAATAAVTRELGLPALAARLCAKPLEGLARGDGEELRVALAQAFETFAALGPQAWDQYAWLATLGARVFGLDSPAAIRAALPGRPRTNAS